MTDKPPAREHTVDELLVLLESRGGARYGGESISQLEHALQCATLAEAAGSAPSVIAAALLHDVGHLMFESDDSVAAERGVDLRHEVSGATALRPLFGEAVAAPVRLHVAAKRYLCAIEADYLASLSDASITSLEVQGGIFSAAHAERFASLPYALDAVAVRRFDDAAKVVGAVTPDVAHFAPLVRSVAAH